MVVYNASLSYWVWHCSIFRKGKIMNLEEKLEDFELSLKETEKADATIKKYRTNVNAFIKYVEDKKLTKRTVIEFKEQLDSVDKYLPNTTNNYLIVLNKFFKFIDREDLCVKIIKQQNKFSVDYSLSKSDYHRLLRTTKKYEEDDNYIILRILAETGIRISELSFFKVESLSKTIKVRNKGKDREIPVKLDLLRAIRKYCRDKKIKEGLVIFNPKTNKAYADSTIWRRLKKIAGRARVNKNSVHPHAFRHYFAKCYLETYPNDIAGLADILGHNSLETTRIYTKLTNKEKELKIRNIKF
jgi:site-specific recombinase XerD